MDKLELKIKGLKLNCYKILIEVTLSKITLLKKYQFIKKYKLKKQLQYNLIKHNNLKKKIFPKSIK